MARPQTQAEAIRMKREELNEQAKKAEAEGELRKAAELYGQVFSMERGLAGLTRAARDQMRCMKKIWSLECR